MCGASEGTPISSISRGSSKEGRITRIGPEHKQLIWTERDCECPGLGRRRVTIDEQIAVIILLEVINKKLGALEVLDQQLRRQQMVGRSRNISSIRDCDAVHGSIISSKRKTNFTHTANSYRGSANAFDRTCNGVKLSEELDIVENHTIGTDVNNIRSTISVGNEAMWSIA